MTLASSGPRIILDRSSLHESQDRSVIAISSLPVILLHPAQAGALPGALLG
jgi:hypothetical protein